MRYFVISRSELDQISPHIIAEVVRGQTDDRRETLAAALAGKDHMIVTREQLVAHPLGLNALTAWEAQDDSIYNAEREALRGRDAGRQRMLSKVATATVATPPVV